MSQSELIRLSKLMSDQGLCSRREADRLIEQGLVFVNGEVVNVLGTKVPADSKITLDTKAQKSQSQLATIILNKPIKYTSHGTDKDYLTVLDLIQSKNQFDEGPRYSSKMKVGLAPVGRLDIESQGLMLMSQDGRVAKAVIGPESRMDKEYLVRFQGELTKDKLEQLSGGHIQLDRRQLKPAQIDQINEDQLRFVLTEGVNRQIRRMMETVDLEVTGLKRVRIGPIRLGRLPEGSWRHLSSAEVGELLQFQRQNTPSKPPARPTRRR